MNRKILVSSALATIFFGGLLQATAVSTADSYAVFKYDSSSVATPPTASTGWNSFENDTNRFTSLTTFDGQYDNNSKHYLGIALGGTNGSVLSLQNLNRAFDKNNSMQVGVYVDVASVTNAENMLQISTTNSTLVSNLRFVDSSKKYIDDNKNKTIATLTFDGNHTITTSDLTYVNETNAIKLGETAEKGGTGSLIEDSQATDVSGTTGNNQYALVGAVFNSSGGTVNLTFTSGARMFGDVETKSSSNSQTILTFGKRSYEKDAKQYLASDGKMKGTVFEGGITSNTSQTTLNLYRGSAYIHSVTSGTNGLLAQNNGANIINVGDKTTKLVNSGQTLRITEMKSQTNGGNYTYNYINFQNGINSTNSPTITNQLNVDTTITANHGQNFIVTQKLNTAESDLVINVGNAIATSSNANATLAKHNIRNFIDINGSLVVGKDGLKNYQNGATLGITTRVGITEITLRNSSDYSSTPATKLPSNINTALGDNYNEKHSLSTSQIYATGSDVEGTSLSKYSLNSIKLEGDLTLIYKDFAEDTTRKMAGGRIFSANGGLNRIEVNGTINVAKYYGGDNGGTNSIDPSNVNANQMWILTTSYSGDYATGGNDIVIKNVNNKDITLGSLYAFEGINNLILNQSATQQKIITIQNMYASKTDLDGNVKKGGDNAVTVFDGSNITFNNITTQEGGRNVVYLLRKNITTGSDKTTTTFNNISYGVGGETEIVVGVRGTKDSSASSNSPVDLFSHSKGVDITLKNDGTSHQVALTIDRTGTTSGTGVVLNIGSGKLNATDYFLGDIRYMEFGASPGNGTYISYSINKNATFIANLNKADTNTVVQKNKGLALKDGAKAILSFHQGFNNTLNFEQIADSGGTLTLTTSTNTDSNLLLNSDKLSSTVLDIASLADNASMKDYNHDIKTIYQRRTTNRTLTFNSVKFEGSGGGTPLVRLFAGENETGKYADKIKITSLDTTPTNTAKKINTQIFLAPQLIGEDLTSANLVVFEAPSEVRLENKEAITDDIIYTVGIVEDTTNQTNSVWKIGKVGEGSIVSNTAEYLTSALGVNYSLFVQNINSLNKRMGELRGNDKSQGVWARVFTGKQTSTMDFIPVDTYYTTVQGGYDYGFNVDGAKNYLGLSLAYNNGQSDSSKDLSSLSISDFKATTNTIDFGIYNSYIQDEGWFSDTIMKFSYFMSSFDITQAKGNITTQTNNFGFTLGEEFGYRFTLGETKEWFIDPQAEFVLGYLSSSNLVDGATTANIQDTLLFRSRIGSDFGYALKINGNQYDFRLGMSYEYDVANGSVDITNTLGGKTYSHSIDNAIENDGRVVLNVGTNMKFGDNMRLYLDFEKSFAGKITTDYQVNLGFRYGFGEKLAKITKEEKKEDKTPLKIEDNQQSQTQVK